MAVGSALALVASARASRAADAGDAGVADGGDAGGDAARLDLAKSLFRNGIAMFDAGDYERALDFFQRSREAYPSPLNWMNVALCLDKLGRFDEALDAYETTLVTFGDALDPSDRAAIASATSVLRGKVARLDVSANATGTVLVDGRERAKLPLKDPIRVLAGHHVVRVVKDGYKTWEGGADPKPGETLPLDAKLEPLAAAGELRIEDPQNDGSRVFVDGVAVGQAPWEGTLGPGAHVVWSAKGDVGSAPTSVIVLQGQTALVRLKSAALGPVARVEAKPATASIALSGVPMGAGAFEARLPAGDYVADAREPGYFPKSASFTVPAGGGAPVHVAIDLAIDPNDPRWPKPVVKVEPPPGHVWVGAFGGAVLGSTFGSDAESVCPQRCASDAIPFGAVAGARAAFRFRAGWSIEASAAYMAASQPIQRTRTGAFPTDAPAYTVTYALHDDVSLAGMLVGLGASDEIDVATRLAIVPRATIGVLLGHARDPVTGTASAGGETAPVQIAGAGDSQSVTRVVLAPEVDALVPLGSFEVGAGLALFFVPGTGPHFPNGPMQVAPSCSPSAPGAVGCAPSTSILANERALGAFFLWVPEVQAAYVF